MIVISSPTAQCAALTSDLNTPPVLTIKAQYGSYVCEGLKYTSVCSEGKASPSKDKEIPKLEENEVVLIKTVDLETIGGLMRAKGVFPENEEFWEAVASSQHFTKVGSEDIWERYQGVLAWLEDNNPLTDHDVHFVDVTDFCEQAFSFIKLALDDGFLAKRMGRARIYLREKLDEKSFHKEYPSGLLCRKTDGPFVNDLFRDSRVICTYNAQERSITVSSKSKVEGFSCREICANFWGGDVWGDDVLAGSPNYRALGEGEYLKVVMKIVEALSRV